MHRPDVLLAVRDLFFRVKLETMLRGLNRDFAHLQGGRIAATAAGARPRLVLVDLGDAGLDPLEEVRRLRANSETAELPVIGFAAHGERELRAAALSAGCSAVVSRGRLAAGLSDVLAPWLSASTPR